MAKIGKSFNENLLSAGSLLAKSKKTLSDFWNLSEDEGNEIAYQQNKDRPFHDIVNEERQAYTALLSSSFTKVAGDPFNLKETMRRSRTTRHMERG